MQQSLFSVSEISNDILKKSDKIKSRSLKIKQDEKSVIGKINEKCSHVIGDIKMDETIHYASMGEWSMHELLHHILSQTGLSDVYIATWSFSEDSVRKIIGFIENGMIQKLYGVLDWRVKVRRPEVMALIKYNISDIKLATCHAKVTVIQNENWSVSIIGSANYTNNPRIESGVIACNKEIADFHKNWILGELNNAKPFE